MRKATLLVILCLVLVSVFVLAEVDVDRAFSFVISQRGADGSYNGNVIETAGALLALSNINYDPAQEIAFLQNLSDPQGCWPRGACKIRETAFAVMALDAHGVDVRNGTEYLLNAQSVASLSGKWLLQIATDRNGTCSVSFEDASGNLVEKDVRVEGGRFPTCAGATFLDINACLQPGIVNARAPLVLDVNCNDLGTVEVISTIFRSGNTYYLVDEQYTSRAEVVVENGCYGVNRGGSCDYDATLWANIALVEVGESATSEFYLRQNGDQNNALHQAAILLVTGDPLVAERLVDLQRNDGSWDRNVLFSALAAKALRSTEFSAEAANVVPFFESVQDATGAIGSLFETEMVLWGGLPSVSVSQTCFEGQQRLCNLQDGVCSGAFEVCMNGTFVGCNETVYESFNVSYEPLELACDGLDNDCDGSVDTGCACLPGEEVACSNNLGVCANATQQCVNGTLSECGYSDLPNFEGQERSCNDNLDNDCDGLIDDEDEDCAVTSQICNLDDVCDYDRGESQNNCAEDCDASCSNGLRDPFEEDIDCGGPCSNECSLGGECFVNEVCELSYGENSNNCAEDCFCGDGFCDSAEDEFTCASDCADGAGATCGDGVCDALTEDEDICPLDCSSVRPPGPEEDGGFGWLLWVLLLLLVIGGGAYFWYKKKSGKKKDTSPFGKFTPTSLKRDEKDEKKPIFQSLFAKKEEKKAAPSIPVSQPRPSQKKSSGVEDELSKSIAEAKKLLGEDKKK